MTSTDSSKLFESTWSAACVVFVVTLLSAGQARSEDDSFFEQQVRPLLEQRCIKCHGGVKTKGGLALDSRIGWQKGGENGPAIVPGKPEGSLLIQAINYDSLQMPPEDAGGKLSGAEIAVLTKWVQQGAHDPRDGVAKLGGMDAAAAKSWWAFQPQRTGRIVTATYR